MDAHKIYDAISQVKVNARGHYIGKSKATNEIQSMHLTEMDNVLTDIRIFVAKIYAGHTTSEALKMIDEFIYKKQVG